MSSFRTRTQRKNTENWRMKAVRLFFFLAVFVVVIRLFNLQVVSAAFYDQLASGQHDFYKELFAERGSIFVKDWKADEEFIAATNEPRAFVYADPRKIEDPRHAAIEIGKILGYELPAEGVALTPEALIEEHDSESKQTTNRDILDGVLEDSPEPVEEVILDTSDQTAEVVEVNSEEGGVVDVTEEVPNEILVLLERFSKKEDPYEPVARNVDNDTLQRILDLQLEGIDYVLEDGRSYPEQNLGGHVFGFVSVRDDQSRVGNYGIEGYFNDFLSGKNGFLDTQTDISGRWIGVGFRNFQPAEDGGDVLLTLDRTVQYVACHALVNAVERYQADGGSVVIIEPKTGRVIAMCSAPEFNPNTYNEVEDFSFYNNKAIFQAYEPGSVFKPLVMAGALDQGVLSPNTLFNDTGEEKIDEYTIRNSDLKAHGLVTMTEVLQESLNTGMIHVMRLMTGKTMLSYIKAFGFGEMTGIHLNTEVSGTIDSLYKDHEIYYATASYGQGITTTPLQLAMAYGAIANGGKLMRPYIVEQLRYKNGNVEETKPQVVRQVISSKTATTIGAMMVSVVEDGHAKLAQVPGYYIAGKTGTAQVAKKNGNGYEQGVTNATFVGFGPVEDPMFAMVVSLNHPKTSQWAADTSAAVFGEIADFLVHYFEVAPTRSVEE